MSMRIVNLVLEYKLIGQINLEKLQIAKNFSGYMIKIGTKTCKVYNKNYCIVTGVKEVCEADSFIRQLFPINPIITRRIVLVTGSGKIPFDFSVNLLLEWHRLNLNISPLRYEGEIFPAIYWTHSKESIYFFHTGSIIITGAKSISQLEKSWKKFLKNFKKVCSKAGAIKNQDEM